MLFFALRFSSSTTLNASSFPSAGTALTTKPLALLCISVTTDLDSAEEEISTDRMCYLSIFVCYYQETLNKTLDRPTNTRV